MWKLFIAATGTSALLLGLTLTGARAEEEPPGMALFKKNKCTQCHTIQAVNISKEESEEEEEAVEGEEKVDPPDLPTFR